MERKPMIGVLPLWDEKKESYWMLPGYMEGIEQAGGIPVMLPMTPAEETLEQLVEVCDGFLFTGGHDVSPQVYGEQPRFENVVCCRARDEMEKLLLKKALDADKAIFGICRGIQFLNAALGGNLYQDLPKEFPSLIEHHQLPPYDVSVHEVCIERDSPLYALFQRETLSVNSYHHQAVRTLSPELKAMATAPDGIVEAVYMPHMRFVWAVQWHPEFALNREESRALFAEFVRNAGIYV